MYTDQEMISDFNHISPGDFGVRNLDYISAKNDPTNLKIGMYVDEVKLSTLAKPFL